MRQLRTYPVWDTSVRWFHWINVLCVLGLVAVGLAILNDKALGVSNDGKILLKTVHVWIGYVFALNLFWRLVWGFIGGIHSRWRAILPLGRAYPAALRRYVAALRAGEHPQYLGHNPLGRIAVTLLLLLLVTMAATGLVLAGTDLFLAPFGSTIARWVAAPGVDPATLVPYAPEMYDKSSYAAMRALRAPFVRVHEFAFYGLLIMGVIHIAAVVLTEVRGGGNLVSAMITGKKILRAPLSDQNKDASP
ncbi:MAG TPA: cytochrome b/b6 domain-containing protein [Steroidobacteraceae bacterium]